MEWRWNVFYMYIKLLKFVLILVLMEWRWNKIKQYEKDQFHVLILVLMEWRWNLLIPLRIVYMRSLNPCSNGMALEQNFIH